MSKPTLKQIGHDVLQQANGPAWIIDPLAAQIVAQNSAGAALLGLCGALDGAMPALASLRAARGLNDPETRSLVFWTPRGVRCVECAIDTPPGLQAGHVRVLAAFNASRQKADAMTAHDIDVDGTSRPMDDGATLREIARRIILGTEALANGSGTKSVMADDAALHSTSAQEAAAAHAPEPEAEPSALRNDAGAADETAQEPAPVSQDVIATLAHELKTPLSAIAAASEIMKEQSLGPIGSDRYQEYAADIHSGARHALAVIERLLSGAVAGGGEQPNGAAHGLAHDVALSLTPCDLNAIARSCMSSMRPLADKARLDLRADLHPGLPPITADETSLRQILLNLMTNAVKFCRPGDVISLRTRLDDARAIVLEVRDTGPGMAKSDIRNALQPLQVQGGTPRAGGGMGLGLGLVRSLVEANSGGMTIKSAKGDGTVITITFTRKRLIPV